MRDLREPLGGASEQVHEARPHDRPGAAHSMGRRTVAWQKCTFAIVPAIGLLELLAHIKQVASVPTDQEWKAARTAVERKLTPADLLIFAPEWAEPLGREFFGAELASTERIARGDETRFPRAVELSIRGAHRPEIAGWKSTVRETVGPFELTIRENPEPVQIVDDLIRHVRPDAMSVSVGGDHETPCPWVRGPVMTGGLGYGPSVPAERFACGGEVVARTVISDPTYRPRQCIYAPPPGGSAVLRLRFHQVTFGRRFHGHHAIAAEADHANGAPVTVVFRAGGNVIGTFTRRDGTGWTPFEIATDDLAGQTTELVAEITAARGDHRQYCFEADTR